MLQNLQESLFQGEELVQAWDVQQVHMTVTGQVSTYLWLYNVCNIYAVKLQSHLS